MCGRYTVTKPDQIAAQFEAMIATAEATTSDPWWKPRFNVAPTQPAPVITLHDGARTIEMMRWGLVPFWGTKDGSKPPLMINARAESLMAKAWFRDALARKRCLVPADGFFEWRHEGKKSLPIYFRPDSHKIFAFAGLWARARNDAGEQLSFTIITGKPNELVKPVHDRMPVVLDEDAYAKWLDPNVDAEAARAMLGIPAVGDWHGEPVSTWVNSAQHDDPQCIAPDVVADRRDDPSQGSLF